MQSSRRILSLAFCCFVFFAVHGFAASVTTSSVCFISGQTTLTGSGVCSLSGLAPAEAQANTFASFSVQSNVISTTASTSAQAISPNPGFATASSVASFNLSLYTTGPVRNGYIEVFQSATWGVGLDGASGTLNYSLGPISRNCPTQACLNIPSLIPFTLGTTFQLSETQDFEAFAYINTTGEGTALGTTNLSFSFFEADGTTAVNVFNQAVSAPEPTACALLGLGLLITAYRRVARQ